MDNESGQVVGTGSRGVFERFGDILAKIMLAMDFFALGLLVAQFVLNRVKGGEEKGAER